MPQPFRRIALVALLLLGGCNSTRVGKDYALTGKAAETDAVLVAQIRPVSAPRDVKSVGLMLQRYEPVSGQLVGTPVYLMNVSVQRPNFSIMRVPPGDYVIRAVISRHVPLFGFKEIVTTVIDGTLKGQGYGATLSWRGAVGDGMRVQLAAGEVSYIGDYLIEVHRRINEFVTVERRDEAARLAVVRGRPKLSDARFVYRGPVDAGGTPVAPGSRPRIVGVEEDGSIQVKDLEQPGLETVEMPR